MSESTTAQYAYLKPYERAARILCGLDNENPDALVPSPHPIFPSVVIERPQWHGAAEALIQFSKMLTALQMARHEAAAEDETEAGAAESERRRH